MNGLFGHGLNTEHCQLRETDEGEHVQAACACAQGSLDLLQGRRPAHLASPEMTP